MTLKKHAALLLAAALVLCSGCGADRSVVSSGGGQSSQPSESSRGTASAASGIPDSDDALVIYTPHDAEPMNAGIVAFMSKYPNIKVEVIAGGTGELCERVAAEAAKPEADVLWGGGADSMEAYSDYFSAYSAVNNSHISSQFKDEQEKWTGESPLPMVIIYNKKLLEEAGIKAPTSWNDCLNPALKGKIAYCQPSKSGSAYTQLCTMILANGGKEAGWDYVEKFAENLGGNILDSSGKCHKLVASGEYMIGITIEKSAAQYRDNPNIGFCYPSEGTSAVPDAVAIIKNCRHPDNARLFVDFVTSRECQDEQSSDWSRRPSRDDVSAPAGLAPMSDIRLVDYDFSWAAGEKENIIARFGRLMG
jgi:iron(III) transport system substrate-binding protein